MKPNRLPGHTLPYEGRVKSYFGLGNGPGRAKCSCGAESSALESTAARQRWHRQHKDEIREAGLIDESDQP